MRAWLRRLASWWVSFSLSHPYPILLSAAAVLLLTIPVILKLRIDTDLARLLPPGLPEVRALEKLKQKIGDLGYFSVMVESGDLGQSVRFAQLMEKKLRGSPWVRTVVYENPVDFVRRYKYLWLPADQLSRIGDFLEKEHCRHNPFCVSLDDDGTGKPAGAGEVRAWLEQYGAQVKAYEAMPRYHVSDDGRILALRVRPGRSVTSLGDVRTMKEALEAAAAGVRKESRLPAIRKVLIGGSLRARIDEYEIVRRDVTTAGWISSILILIMLLAALRNPWSMAAAVIPLLFGMALAFAVTTAVIGHLNTLTSLLFSVMMGFGIDIGIHFVYRLRALRSSGLGPAEALRATLTRTGGAMLTASITTALGFFIMLASDFRGFSDLGFIAGIGILSIMLGYALLFPALVAAAERLSISLQPLVTFKPRAAIPFLSSGSPVLAVAVNLLILLAGAYCLTRISFNYDFDSLSGTSRASDEVRSTQGKVYTTTLTPGGVIFAPDQDAARAIIDQYGKRMKSKDSVIEKVASLTTFLPPDQDKRLEELGRISGLITPKVLASVDDQELRIELERMKEAAGLRPLTPETLPSSLREMLVVQDGSKDIPVYIYGRERLTNGLAAMRFASQAGGITVGGRRHVPTGGAIIYASVLRRVMEQGPWLLLASLLFIAVIVTIQFRGILRGAAALIPLVQGLAIMVIVMAAFRIQLNMYNMAILCTITGLGVDYGIYLYSHFRDLPVALPAPERASQALQANVQPILFSWLTTMAGYVGLVLSHHPGLRSIGVLAAVGLGGCFLMSVTLLPYTLSARITGIKKLRAAGAGDQRPMTCSTRP